MFPDMACFALPPSGNALPAADLLRGGTVDFGSACAFHLGCREGDLLWTDSGSSALYTVLRAVAVTRGPAGGGEPGIRGRVAVPAWCCPSVPQAAVQAGLDPVLIDVDPDTLEYRPESLAAAWAHPRGLAAVVLVHFFGMPAEIPPGPPDGWGATVFIRDCAQDFDYVPPPDDRSPCVYSFGRGKALNAGHGGALRLPSWGRDAGDDGDDDRDGGLEDACRRIHRLLPENRAHPLPKALALNLLSRPHMFWALSRMPGLGIGRTVWKAPLEFARMSPAFGPTGAACLEAYLRRRQAYLGLADRYRALIAACDPARVRLIQEGGVAEPEVPERIAPGEGISGREAARESPPEPTPGAGSDWTPVPERSRAPGVPTRFPILFADRGLRDRFLQKVMERYGGVTRMYREALPDLPGAPARLSGAGEDPRHPGALPGARRLARELATLPVTASLIGREDGFLGFLEEVLRRAGAFVRTPPCIPAPARLPSFP